MVIVLSVTLTRLAYTHSLSPLFAHGALAYGGFAIGKLPECIIVSTPDIGSSFTNGGVEFNARVIFIIDVVKVQLQWVICQMLKFQTA
jgi:hypothetical protein